MVEKAEGLGVKAYFMLVQSRGEDMKQIAHLLATGVITLLMII